ncbi:MAG: Spx/MgsR family RNA polymerase-binding regulatory protein [Bacteroidia bacterium]|nr:Spx/MgsR family RNA polymerase-binding regulatory protein [Bacteroidia bacterium]
MSVTIYGIKSCDTMKKAFNWLIQNGIDYTFIDYKIAGITEAKLNEWLKHIDVKKLINTKGTTFKKLSTEQQLSITDLQKAVELMQANSSMIKRPLVEFNGTFTLGFDAETWGKLFDK